MAVNYCLHKCQCVCFSVVCVSYIIPATLWYSSVTVVQLNTYRVGITQSTLLSAAEVKVTWLFELKLLKLPHPLIDKIRAFFKQ